MRKTVDVNLVIRKLKKWVQKKKLCISHPLLLTDAIREMTACMPERAYGY